MNLLMEFVLGSLFISCNFLSVYNNNRCSVTARMNNDGIPDGMDCASVLWLGRRCVMWRCEAAQDACWTGQDVRAAGQLLHLESEKPTHCWTPWPRASCFFQTLCLKCSERNSLCSPLPVYPRAELLGLFSLSLDPLSSRRVWGVALRSGGSRWGIWRALLCSAFSLHRGPWRSLRPPFCCPDRL